MIKNIIFDMGNVLLRFAPDSFLDRYNVEGSDRILLKNKVFRSVEWVMLDRGTLTEEAAEQRILPKLPERLHQVAHKLIAEWDEPLVPVEGTVELLQTLKQNGYALYLLSNASVRQPIYWERMEASKYFAGTLISAHVHQIKPNPDIYQTFLKKFDLVPAECVFIDDSPANIEAAIGADIYGIVFNNDVSELKQELVSLGVALD